MLKRNKSINNVSDKFAKEIRSKMLKRGESAIYKLTGLGRKDADGKPIIPSSVKVPSSCYITDPHTDLPVQIGLVKELRGEHDFKLDPIWFRRIELGQKIINGGGPDVELHLYLYYSNYNGSNPNRNTDVKPIYEYYDVEKEAKAAGEKTAMLRNALNYASAMKEDAMRDYATAKGLNGDKMEVYSLRKLVEDHAKNAPQEFLNFSKNDTTGILADVKRASRLQVISFNIENNAWEWTETKETIINIPRQSNKDEALASYFAKDKKGQRVYSEVKKMSKEKVAL